MARKRVQPTLWVKAVPEASVREIDEFGRPLGGQTCRMVGKSYNKETDDFTDIDQTGVDVPYHPMYITRLKEKALLPMDIQTAMLAGVRFDDTLI
jgi:hypothetical protein